MLLKFWKDKNPTETAEKIFLNDNALSVYWLPSLKLFLKASFCWYVIER